MAWFKERSKVHMQHVYLNFKKTEDRMDLFMERTKRGIASGALKPHDAMPTAKVLSNWIALPVDVTTKAYNKLIALGILYTNKEPPPSKLTRHFIDPKCVKLVTDEATKKAKTRIFKAVKDARWTGMDEAEIVITVRKAYHAQRRFL